MGSHDLIRLVFRTQRISDIVSIPATLTLCFKNKRKIKLMKQRVKQK